MGSAGLCLRSGPAAVRPSHAWLGRIVNALGHPADGLGPLPVDETPLKAWGNSFEYLGRTDQDGVVQHMQQADVLVLPSVFEGFGLVIVAATSASTGNPELCSLARTTIRLHSSSAYQPD